MSKKQIIHLMLIGLSSVLWGQKKTEWIPPLDLPLSLSGTFGEPRSTHFHLGIDIKTQGSQGWEVKSVAPGYISRIRVSLGGYGKALYINHPDQTTSVYAHLKKFAPKIENYLKSNQYKNKSYTIQKFPKRDAFYITAGEVIGYSGNTGSSTGPHLHFEIRDTKSQKPLNPLLFDLYVKDSQRPQIQNLHLFYPENNSIITPSESVPLKRVNDSTYNTSIVTTSGKIGLGIVMFDQQDLSPNKNGIYKAQVKVNGKNIVQYKYDQLDYSDSKKLFINVDYPTFKKNKRKIQKLFFQNHQPLTFMKSMNGEGVFHIELGKSYQIKVTIEDFSGNSSYIEIYVEGAEKQIQNKILEGKLIETGEDYLIILNKKKVYFPKNTFFERTSIQIEEYEKTLSVGPDLFPFNNPYEIRFLIDEEDTLKLRQTFIAKKRGQKLSFLPTTFKDGQLETKVKNMGDFIVSRDSIPPKIVPSNFKPNQWLSKLKYLKIKIFDDFSGVKSYSGLINGEWILFEYEPKSNLLTYDFSDKIFELAKHDLLLEVEDNVGNKTVYETTFFRKYLLD